MPFDQIRIDTIFEIQHEVDPQKLWYARVVKNVGGRLLLQYEGGSDAFWLFYTNWRLHPLGFSSEQNKRPIAPFGECMEMIERDHHQRDFICILSLNQYWLFLLCISCCIFLEITKKDTKSEVKEIKYDLAGSNSPPASVFEVLCLSLNII